MTNVTILVGKMLQMVAFVIENKEIFDITAPSLSSCLDFALAVVHKATKEMDFDAVIKALGCAEASEVDGYKTTCGVDDRGTTGTWEGGDVVHNLL